ncbi:MAG: class I SAM-dependent methyltransferase [Phycisphaerae bacterium]|nr:class I SAM-dependent methyltransferase [Phycisphaerae bacterium]
MNQDQCPLCNSTANHKLFATNGYDMLACDNCELMFISPFPQSEKQRFQQVAANKLADITVIDPEHYSIAREIYYQELFPLVKPAFQKAKSLLDIGCGTGHLLTLAKQCGIKQCDGLELNTARATYAREHTGCDIIEKPIEEFQTDKKYDVITLIDVLSHIYSYDKLFVAVKSLLNANGLFVIKTGQFAAGVQRGSVFDWEVPDHLHFMGMATSDYIAKKYGLEIISQEQVAHADELYTRERFLTKGRSCKRNLIKAILAYTPFAIKLLKWQYLQKHGRNVFSTVIVLQNKKDNQRI